jgi:hypothetical protein
MNKATRKAQPFMDEARECLAALLIDYEKHGPAAIEALRQQNPMRFVMSVAAAVNDERGDA